MAENFYGLTDIGRVRSNNEDTFIAQTVQKGRYILAAVIDGVGGYDGGEIAAEIAREQLVKQLSQSSANIVQAMADAFQQANDQIYARKQQDKQLDSMACVATLAVIDLQSNQFYYAHVGDTRLYLLRDHSLVKITKDHSFVGFLEDSGRLSETAAMTHPKRNEINKALGFSNTIASEKDYVETGQSPFLSGDMLLLCSDGLTDLVDKSEMTSICTGTNTLAQKAQQLIDAANRNGGKDNVTVVLVQNDKQAIPQQPTMPSTNGARANGETKAAPVVQPLVNHAAAVEPVIEYRTNKTAVTILSLLCLAFLAAAGWFYWQSTQSKPAASQQQKVVEKPHGVLETKLQDTINHVKGDTLVLTAQQFAQPIVISDTLKINRDTLVITTKGKIELKGDSSYKGLAIQLGSGCKHVVLDGLIFNGFHVGVMAENVALQLKKVQFMNCIYPVQITYVSQEQKPVSGTVPALKLIADTAFTTSNKPHGSK